jgi:hypothetical protein
MLLAITKRYWFWQQKKMLADGVGYTCTETLYDELRPLAFKFIEIRDGAGTLTPIPNGWKIDVWTEPKDFIGP